MDGPYGHWVEDDDSGEQGSLPEVEDVFWTYDEETYAWVSGRLGHRKLRRGKPKGKGKSKGKGRKGYGRFRPAKGKGKSGKGDRSQILVSQQEYFDLCALAKGKGKGKKGKPSSFQGPEGAGQGICSIRGPRTSGGSKHAHSHRTVTESDATWARISEPASYSIVGP